MSQRPDENSFKINSCGHYYVQTMYRWCQGVPASKLVSKHRHYTDLGSESQALTKRDSRSVSQLKQAIPAELFVKNTPRAFVYLLRDLVQCAALFYLAYVFETSENRTIRVIRTTNSTLALCLRAIFWAS